MTGCSIVDQAQGICSDDSYDDGLEPPVLCRLCAGEAGFSFARVDTDGDRVCYYKCTVCKSLQTEMPYWLDEVYRLTRRPGDEQPDLDTGAVERTTYGRTAVFFLATLGEAIRPGDKVIIGKEGPACWHALLRDAGIDAYSYDKFVPNHFAAGFGFIQGITYAMATCFEVFEHFAEPSQDVAALFEIGMKHILISTEVFDSHGPDWNYLGPPRESTCIFLLARCVAVGGAAPWLCARLPATLNGLILQESAESNPARLDPYPACESLCRGNCLCLDSEEVAGCQ